MSTPKKENTNMEEVQAALQARIAQGKKEGMIRLSDLNAQLEKLQLSPDKIEEIYDRFEAMNIPLITAELELNDDTMPMDDGDIDLSGLEEEELVDPVDLAAEYSLDDPVRMYLKEIGQVKLLSACQAGFRGRSGRQEQADGGQPPAGGVHCQEVFRPGSAHSGSDSGGQHGPDSGGGQV